MELRQLRYLVAVVEEASFTRAAERLHVAQPGVSAQIRQLERELGRPLLDRTGRSVTPTEVGEAVLPHARAALAAVDGVRQAVAEFGGLLRGRVGIGLVPGTLGHAIDVPGVLAGFHDDHPQVEITLTEATSDLMLTALRRGELDIAVVGLADREPPPGVAVRVLVDVPLVVAVADGHPLLVEYAGRTAVPPAALREHALVSLPSGTGVRGALEGVCAEAGFRPRVAFEAAAPEALTRLAARGLGAAVVPEAETPGELRTLRIDHPRARGRIALAWRTEGPTGPAARALLDRLRETLPRQGAFAETV
ncbi:LysR family transcriptional regulator [Streptomyces sp. NPDC056039]|uniref:LysR family transcriptional regulator n=1 Tax=Streptomyces sp. NPDC056039 TaxID=3345687 RepID=UPI0035DA1A94